MTRDETIFRIYYSMFIETMHSTLYGRLDRLTNFLLLFLGSAVFASYGNTVVFGGFIALISAANFVWQFSRSAVEHQTQASKLKQLLLRMGALPDSELLSTYERIEEDDTQTLGLLRDAAHKRALILTGKPEEARAIRLTLPERIFAHLAGDCPKDE